MPTTIMNVVHAIPSLNCFTEYLMITCKVVRNVEKKIFNVSLHPVPELSLKEQVSIKLIIRIKGNSINMEQIETAILL